MPATTEAPATQDREAMIEEIGQLEQRLEFLKRNLPSTIKRFYHINVSILNGETRSTRLTALVYAENQEQALAKLEKRMDGEYPAEKGIPRWQFAGRVIEYLSAEAAESKSRSSLFKALTPSDTSEFVADYLENQKGRDPKPKGSHLTSIERQVEHYLNNSPLESKWANTRHRTTL